MSVFARRTAVKAKSPERSLRAVSRLSRPKDLYAVALKSKHPASQKAAIARLGDPQLLHELLCEVEFRDGDLILDVADKLPKADMQYKYCAIAKGYGYDVKDRQRALGGIIDEDKVISIATGWGVWAAEAVIARLTKPTSFVQLAIHLSRAQAADSHRMCLEAVHQLQEEEHLAEVAAHAGPDVARVIIRRINDPALLTMIANTTRYPAAMIAATRKLPKRSRSQVEAHLVETARDSHRVGVESRMWLADFLGRLDLHTEIALDQARRKEWAFDRLDTSMLLKAAADQDDHFARKAVDRLLETGQGERLRGISIKDAELRRYACGKLGHDYGEKCLCQNCGHEEHTFHWGSYYGRPWDALYGEKMGEKKRAERCARCGVVLWQFHQQYKCGVCGGTGFTEYDYAEYPCHACNGSEYQVALYQFIEYTDGRQSDIHRVA